MRDFAECAAARRPNAARHLLALDYRTDAYSTALIKFADVNSICLSPGSQLRFGGVLLAGGLAERLFLIDHRRIDAARLVAAAKDRGPIEARDESETMSLCLVYRAPDAARALLDTAVTTAREAAAMQRLLPDLNACLAAGSQVRLNRISLRSLISLALYRTALHGGTAPSLTLSSGS